MDKNYRDKILAFVESTYRSLQQPDFTFVKRVSSNRPYEPLVKRLRDYAVVEHMTESEDEVCFVYLIKGQSRLWKLDLSMVGPFGVFVRLSPKCSTDDFVHAGKEDVNAYERKIIDMLRAGGITLLTTKQLADPIPLSLFNTPRNEVCLYHALFCDRPAFPWE